MLDQVYGVILDQYHQMTVLNIDDYTIRGFVCIETRGISLAVGAVGGQ